MAGSNHPGNPQNAISSKKVRTRSKFPLNWKLLSTERFGHIGVTLATDVVRGDKIPLSSPHSLQSYTLKTPFFGHIRKSKDYFFVAKDAILPLNADKVIVQPTIGDDVPPGVNCSIRNAPYKFWRVVQYFRNEAFNAFDDGNFGLSVVRLFSFFNIGSYFFSPGSLLAACGYNLSRYYSFTDSGHSSFSFDQIFDNFFDVLASDLNFKILLQSGSAPFSEIVGGRSDTRFRLRWLLEKLHDEPSFISNIREAPVSLGSSSEQWLDWFFTSLVPSNWSSQSDYDGDDSVLNFGRLAAYQISCHHFYSNDKIDYIYSAELYRQLVGSYVDARYRVYAGESLPSFVYNGIRHQYDYLSGFVLDSFLRAFSADDLDGLYTEVSYLASIFSWRRSLRYVDYFVGARSAPLAVGDVNVPVSGDGVNVVDLAKRSAFARLLNATNQLGSKAKKWLEGVFPGSDIKWDKHDPAFIGHVVDYVQGDETENTGAAQFEDAGVSGIDTQKTSVTSKFRSRTSRDFAFEYEASIPGYIIGTTYYDIPRVYTVLLERQMMAYDRYDEFNPYMQFTGDQPIYAAELEGVPNTGVFGYQQKDMQYKQGINRAIGGFSAGVLPSWFFDDSAMLNDFYPHAYIGPDKIRSHVFEIDKFYLSLTGWSLSSYFHFIVVYNNEMPASRPMAWIPQLSI